MNDDKLLIITRWPHQINAAVQRHRLQGERVHVDAMPLGIDVQAEQTLVELSDDHVVACDGAAGRGQVEVKLRARG